MSVLRTKIVLMQLAILSVCIIGCGTVADSKNEEIVETVTEENVEDNTQTSGENNSLGAFQKVQAVSGYAVQDFDHGDAELSSIDFEQTDILRFEELSSYAVGELLSIYISVNNIGNQTVTSMRMYFSECDSANIEIGHSNIDGFYAIEPNKSIELSPILMLSDDSVNYNHMIVTAYDYATINAWYHVNLQDKTAVTWEKVSSGLDFDKYNVLTFNMQTKGIDTIGAYKIETTIKNNGELPIENTEFDIVALDIDDNFIARGGGYEYDISAKGTAVTDCYIYNPNKKDFSLIESLGIPSYKYHLTEPDENGYVEYGVDLINMEIKGLR